MIGISEQKRVFLRAEWRKLLMANYIISPELLRKHLPAGTELDFWQGNCYVSLVGFMFLNTEVKGWKFPWHRNFEEVNLRFYVRRRVGDAWRRGVVFIKEIVPKPAIAIVANTLYGERYVTRQMRHHWTDKPGEMFIQYDWKPYLGPGWNAMRCVAEAEAHPIPAGSEAEFITEHYWGYSNHGQKTMEYEVTHPRWDAYKVSSFAVEGPIVQEYGPAFAEVLAQQPSSVFLAEGSEVAIFKGGLFCVDEG